MEFAYAIQGLCGEYVTTSETDEGAIKLVGAQVVIGIRVIHDHIHNSRFFSVGRTFDAELVFAWLSTQRRAAMATLEGFRAA